MRDVEHWDGRYKSDDLPWDTGRCDRNLVELVHSGRVGPCRTVEWGCGTGNNAIWLAAQGFDVTALDLSPEAVERAGQKAGTAGVRVRWLVGDVLSAAIDGDPFSFAFDRGCFHSFETFDERVRFAGVVRRHLRDGGLWYSLIGSTDGPDRDVGPPRLSATDIASAVEPHFEILRLETTAFDSDRENPARAWACLMRVRLA